MCDKIAERLKAFQQNSFSNNSLRDELEDYKLTLRKKNLNELIQSKRIKWSKRENNNHSEGMFSIDLENLDVSQEVRKMNFFSMEEYYQYHFNLLKSNNINEVKYGLGLIRLNLSDTKNSPIIMENNPNTISDLFTCLDKHIADYTICKETVWILTNIIYGTIQLDIKGVILTPRGYRLWDKIFKYNIEELSIDLIWLINNTTVKDHDLSLNLISSNFFSNQLLPYFSSLSNNVSIIKDSLIEITCVLLSNIYHINFKPEEEITLTKILIDIKLILINFSKTTNKTAYQSVMYGLSLDKYVNNLQIKEAIVNSGLLSMIIGEKKFYEESVIALFSNRLIGNYIVEYSLPIELQMNFLDTLIKDMNAFSGLRRRDTMWCLSNYLMSNDIITAFVIKGGFDCLIQFIKTEGIEIRHEALHCLLSIIVYSDMNLIINLLKTYIFNVLVDLLQKHCDEKTIFLSLECIHYFMKCGEVLIHQFGLNPFKVKFLELGGSDLINHILNDEQLKNSKKVEKVIEEMQQFLKEDELLNEYCNPNR